jgi:excisionase family DNA binding protein
MDGTEYLTLREAARRLGVHENTVRNWVADGRLHPVVLPGSSYRKFDATEIQRVAGERRGVVGSIQDSRRTVGPDRVDATLLDSWADRLAARGLFPQLIRALLAATPGVQDLSVRAGEGVALRGWDALVDGGPGSAWVPAGPSAWELGTSADPGQKAQDDYRKRTRNPVGVEPAATTFVFATPRRWEKARDWERKRRQERRWRGVRVLDADDLEGWLQSAPAVHLWISEELGLRPRDAVTLEAWWQRFAARTRPPLPAPLLLAGREGERNQIREALSKAPEIIGLQASSRDEAIAFLAAALGEDADAPAPGLSAIVVTSSDVWHRLVSAPGSSILVPMFEGADVAAAQEAGHRVVVPLGARDVSTGSTIELPRPDRTAAREALEAAGMPFDRADRMAALARRSLSSLQRALAIDPRAARPPWAAPSHATVLAPLVLVGTWSAHPDDQAVVSQVVGRDWAEIERDLTGWTTSDDPPLVKAGGEWRLSSPQEAFSILEPAITLGDLARWRAAALEVLGEVDPALELPAEERPVAALVGRRSKFSRSLRGGIAQGLALLGAFGDRVYESSSTGQDYASLIVRELLERANADETGLLWSSLSPDLPMLAEAAPRAFLDAIDAGLSGEEQPVVATMFQDKESDPWFSSSSPHTGLLWALEKLCWSSEHLLEAATMLARLAEVDPGGRLGNRPPKSLRAVFLPWIPCTAASVEERFRALDALRRHHSSVAWPLMMVLMPRVHDTSSPTCRPEFRDWRPDRERVTIGEWSETIVGLVERAVADADVSPERWADLTEHLGDLPPDQRPHLLGGLEALDPGSLEAAARLLLWRRLTDVAARHRSFPDAKWAMDAASLERLEAVASRMEPVGVSERHARLFEWHPDLPGVDRHDHMAYRQALEDQRAQAVREILETTGIDGLDQLAAESRLPDHVGATAADVAGDDIATDLLARLGTEGKLGELARGWAWRMAATRGQTWITATADQIGALPSEGQISFLLALPARRETWDLADRFDSDIRAAFWKAMRPWAEKASDLEHLVERLLEHGRPWAAIDLLAMKCVANDSVAHPSIELVERLLRAAVEVDPKSDPQADVSGYEIGALLDYLERAGADARTMVELEWTYFSALDHTRVPTALYAALAEDPQLFVELLSRVYRGKSQRRRDLDENETAQAHRAWEVLTNWRTLPGQKEDGAVDAEALHAWVKKARLLLSEADRTDIGDEQIGQLLSGSLPGADGAWPAEAVREVIEMVGSKELDSGLYIGRMNSRGITSRGPYDGGDQERALAATYRQWAREVKPQWPRTARVLLQLADSYERDARREDAAAERDANEG